MTDLKDDVQAKLAKYAEEFVPGARWKHYKGGRYEIVTLALKEDTLEPLVVYRSLDHGTTWVRTIGNFTEPVLTAQGTVGRFSKETA